MKRILLSVFAAAITAAWAIPATAADVSFDGQYRARGEYRANPQFEDASTGGTKDTQSIVLQRVRLNANASITDDTSVKITIQDSREWGADVWATGGPDLTDTGNNHLDLHEAFVKVDDIFGTPVDFKLGTQELNYGDQRLIGAFGWNNNGRSFDAAKFTFNNETVDVDFFAAKVRENTTGVLPNSPEAGDDDQDFYGIYATVKSVPNNTIDVYALLLRDGSTSTAITDNSLHGLTAAGTIDGTQNLWTYGLRVKGGLSDIGIDYTGELAFQSGTIPATTGDVDINALAYALKGGYTLPTDMKIRIGAEYVFASGDDSSTDNEIKTFSNLFPTNHGHMGIADQQAWRNTSSWNVNAKAQVNEQLSVFASYWSFSLDEKMDDWYHAGRWMTAEDIGARLSDGNNDTAATELDIVATYKYNSAVTLQAGYALVFTGDIVDTNVASEEDMDFAYLQLTANF